MKKFIQLFAIFAMMSLVFPACVDQDFDEPPTDFQGPNIASNTTIQALLDRHTIGGFTAIADEVIIEGVIVADDESGNYYKTLIIQDATAGINIQVDQTDLFNLYPIGRRVFIKCQNLYLGDYAGAIQIGAGVDDNNGSPRLERIPSGLISELLIGGEAGQEVSPAERTLNNITYGDVNTLVKVSGVQFPSADANQSYADVSDPNNPRSVNRAIEDCNGNSILFRTSGFASFAGDLTSDGKGDLTAVVGYFNGDYQLVIRDLDDVAFSETRCGGTSGNEAYISLTDLRNSWTGSQSNISDDKKVSGVVISDKDNGNVNSRNLVLQDGTSGIVLRFSDDNTFALGEQLEVVVSGLELSEFNGLLQINNVPNASVTSLGTGTMPTPKVVTAAEITSDLENLESTLVKIESAMISGGTTFSAANSVDDASGSITMFNFNSSSFGNDNVPTGTVEVTGIVSQFNTAQINLRNASDVTGGTGGGGGGGGSSSFADISSLRSAFASGTTAVASSTKVKGIVTSDYANGNMTGKNLVLQDGSAGIIVRFDVNHTFALGHELEIEVSGLELSEYNGLLQINNVPEANTTDLGTGTMPTPMTVTVADILGDLESYESRLVLINGVTITGASTFNGTTSVSDSTGSIDMYTRSDASFSGDAVPSGAVNLTCIVSEFNTPQLNIRNASDVN